MRAAAGVIAAMALAGCSGGGANPGAASAPASASSSSPTTLEVDVQEAQAKAPAPTHGVPVDGSTLNPYLPAFGQLADASVGVGADLRKDHSDKVQAFLAGCMIDEGFDYVPVERAPIDRSWSISPKSLMPIPLLSGDRADVERYGYGVDPGEKDFGPAASPTDEKNVEIQMALSDSEAEAYDKALHGGYQATDEEFAKSCGGKASAAYPEPELPTPPENEFFDLQNAVSQLWTVDVPADERAITLNEEWSACMPSAGIDLVMDNRDIAGPDPMTAFWQAVGTGEDGVMDLKDRDRPADEIPLDRKLLVGSAPEIEIALADFDCRAKTDYESRLAAIQKEHEDKLVVANQQDLDRLLAAVDELEK